MTKLDRIKLDRLDRIDLQILKEMQENGRITNAALAEKVGITAPPCLRRVRNLEKAGYVRGYHAVLDAEALGYRLTIFAQVFLASHAEDDLKRFESAVHSYPEVRECYMLAGEADFLLRIVAPDWESYQTFLTQSLTKTPNISQIKSWLSIRGSKHTPGVPVPDPDSAFAVSWQR
jgi:DNA-binding Lrp family transcriptional regulator